MDHQTARLTLRPPCLVDASELFTFLGDPTAMRHTTVQASVRDCRRYLAVHERQRRRIGCAPWVVIEKATNATIGFGGLYDDPFDPGWDIEVGYFFAPAAWGKSFASERRVALQSRGSRRAGQRSQPSHIRIMLHHRTFY